MGIVGTTYSLRGEPVKVLARWRGQAPRNVLLELADGTKTVRPFRGLRKLHAEADSLEDAPATRGSVV